MALILSTSPSGALPRPEALINPVAIVFVACNLSATATLMASQSILAFHDGPDDRYAACCRLARRVGGSPKVPRDKLRRRLLHFAFLNCAESQCRGGFALLQDRETKQKAHHRYSGARSPRASSACSNRDRN